MLRRFRSSFLLFRFTAWKNTSGLWRRKNNEFLEGLSEDRPFCVREYEKFRAYKLNEPFYPTLAAREKKDHFKDKVIPEFLQYNIWEISVYDVA